MLGISYALQMRTELSQCQWCITNRPWEWITVLDQKQQNIFGCISLFRSVELQGHPEQLNGGDHDWLIQTLVSTVQQGMLILSQRKDLRKGLMWEGLALTTARARKFWTSYIHGNHSHKCHCRKHLGCIFVVAEFNKGIILPTLIRQLQSILQQYPDDGQILKVALPLLQHCLL